MSSGLQWPGRSYSGPTKQASPCDVVETLRSSRDVIGRHLRMHAAHHEEIHVHCTRAKKNVQIKI